MHIDDALLNGIQKCELDILRAFIGVCDQLGLTYYLVEGTLLGAVRHQGFIPWDDDIDVAMPRNDYMRFLKEAQQYFPDYYFVQSVDSDPEYHSNIAKVRDSRTTFIELGIKDRAINHGVYIDVFPIDYVPKQKWRRILTEIQAGIRWIRIVQEFHLPSKHRNWKKRLLGRLIFPYAKLRWPKIPDAVRSRDKLFSSCKDSGLMLNYLSMWRKRGIMPSEWYGEGVFLQFEGLTVRVPAHYDQWLCGVRGIQSGRLWQLVSTYTKGTLKLKRALHYCGQRNANRQIYLVRNCEFEPAYSHNPHKCMETAYEQVVCAFRNKKPAVINSHRFNYISAINSENAHENLLALKELLEKIVRTYPDVVFMSSDQLLACIESKQ